MDIRMEKRLTSLRMRNPFKEYAETEETLEIRTEPLTGITMRMGKSKGLDRIPKNSPLSAFAAESQDFFCRHRFPSERPQFPESLVVGERIFVDKSRLFSNLSGFSHFSGVRLLYTDHYLSFTALTRELFVDAFKACQKYFKACWGYERSRLYRSINWNYLLPSGSGILHPHLRPAADPTPTNYHRTPWNVSTRFYHKHKTSYWDLLLEEKGYVSSANPRRDFGLLRLLQWDSMDGYYRRVNGLVSVL